MRRLFWLFLPLVLAACGEEPYYIAVAGDREAIDGVTLGVRQIVWKGGIDEHPVRVRTFQYDPTTPPEAVLDTMRAWAADTTILVAVVQSGNATTEAVSEALSAGRLPHIIAEAAPVVEGDPDPYRFYLVPPAAEEGRFMAEAAVQHGAGTRVAVFYPDTDYGRAMYEGIRERLEGSPAELVGSARYPRVTDEAQLLGFAGELLDSNPDVVLWAGPIAELTAVLPSLQANLPEDGAVIANSRVETRHLYFNPEGYYTGLQFVRQMDLGRGDEEFADFRLINAAWTGGATVSWNPVLYDAARLLGAAMLEAGPNRPAIREYLAQLGRERPPFEGLAHPVAFVAPGPAVRHELGLAKILPSGVGTVRMQRSAASEDTLVLEME